MKKIRHFIEKYWIYLIIAIIGFSLIIVFFNLSEINIGEWLKSNLIYIAVILSACIIFLTMYLSNKYKR